jgi:hypothetical protein
MQHQRGGPRAFQGSSDPPAKRPSVSSGRPFRGTATSAWSMAASAAYTSCSSTRPAMRRHWIPPSGNPPEINLHLALVGARLIRRARTSSASLTAPGTAAAHSLLGAHTPGRPSTRRWQGCRSGAQRWTRLYVVGRAGRVRIPASRPTLPWVGAGRTTSHGHTDEATGRRPLGSASVGANHAPRGGGGRLRRSSSAV